MTRLFIGIDGNGVPALKIMKNSSAEPMTTPDAQRSKFLYNSNDEAVVGVTDIVVGSQGTPGSEYGSPVSVPFNPNTLKVYFSPPGTDDTDFEKATTRIAGSESAGGPVIYSKRYFDNIQYSCPLLSSYVKLNSSGRYANIRTTYDIFLIGGGYVMTSNAVDSTSSAQSVQAVDVSSTVGSPAFMTIPRNASVSSGAMRSFRVFYNTGSSWGTYFALRDVVAFVPALVSDTGGQVVWNLPADKEPLVEATKIMGTSGVKAIKLNPNEFKIARQGYNVDTADYDELVFSAEKRPAKVLAAGDVLVSAGGTLEVECGVTLNDTVLVEQAIYNTANISFPAPPNLYINNNWNFEYEVTGTKVKFYNDSAQNYRIRYIVIAADTEKQTTGTNKVFRELEVSGEKVFQILRPGAASSPALSDIIIDSRWPSIPILDEGYLDLTDTSIRVPYSLHQTIPITFPNSDDMFPFVKFAVHRQIPGSAHFIATNPVIRKLVGPSATGSDEQRTGGDTVWFELTSSTQGRFHFYPGKPIEWGASAYTYDSYPPIGIRYYIFGIPE